ncbi:MAG TPA: phosphopentomutase [Firmicutes bacterium]|nr:phosphopentomutase [Bacillota bacterium]
MVRRVLLLVIDGLGVGALPDAGLYGDEGSNTLGNLSRAAGGLHIPNLAALGLTLCTEVWRTPSPAPHEVRGSWGVMTPASPGKETMIGHWELAGVTIDRPLDTFPHGFPPELVARFQGLIGRQVLGNVPASGTEIIARLGEKHLRTGFPILYTSADSVFQLAAHEGIVPVSLLYRWCQAAREMLDGSDFRVGRVIARPFAGEPAHFWRTAGRHDWALPPPGRTVLDALQDDGICVTGVGKIRDIFAGRGIGRHLPAAGNAAIMQAVDSVWGEMDRGLVVANLVDFDMLYGHRNDVAGYARALAETDAWLGRLLKQVGEGDLLFITADHGCDPTTPSTDHSREAVPVLVTGGAWPGRGDLGRRRTFADLAATLAEAFSISYRPVGARSFYQHYQVA